MENLFNEVIGQDEAKKQLEFYLKNYHYSKIMPHLLFGAAKGNGKSFLARETAKQLLAYDDNGQIILKSDGTPKKKTFLEVNASTIKSMRSFINSIVLEHLVDKHVTIFFDEASELKNDVMFALLTMLAPNPSNKTNFIYDDQVIDIDFRKQTFIFASSETHLLFPPLKDRLTRIDLQSYSVSELAQIVQRTAPEVKFIDGVIEKVASVVRGNARQAVKMGENIKTYLCDKVKFGHKEWSDLCNILSIKPLGLSNLEIQLLNFMRQRPEGSSLTNLAARSGLSREVIQRDYEGYLMYHGLMEVVAGKGRVLSGKGYEYLKNLEPSAV